MNIIGTIISGLCVAIPSIIATILTNSKTKNLLAYRIDQLEIEQKKHNNLIDRMYKIETRVTVIEDELRERR